MWSAIYGQGAYRSSMTMVVFCDLQLAKKAPINLFARGSRRNTSALSGDIKTAIYGPEAMIGCPRNRCHKCCVIKGCRSRHMRRG